MHKHFQIIDIKSLYDKIFYLKIKPPLLSMRQSIIGQKFVENYPCDGTNISLMKTIDYNDFEYEKNIVVLDIKLL